jgi:ribonuclease HI
MRELNQALKAAKIDAAPGPDGIGYRDLLSLGPEGRSALLESFNEIWRTADYPECWKIGEIIAVPKNGRTLYDNITDFRPICKTPCAGKIYERMVKTRLEWFLERNGHFPDQATGFRRGRGADDSLLDLISDVQHHRSKGKTTAMCCIDIKAAFDRIPHDVILQALIEAKVPRKLYQVVVNYLKDRTVYAVNGKFRTKNRPTSRGVPQGGVLSPLLFAVVLSRLAKLANIFINISIFADDIAIWCHYISRSKMTLHYDLLQRAVNSVVALINSWGMSVSPEKSAVLLFAGAHSPGFNIFINGKLVSLAKTHKFLGVTIDKCLTWAPHIRILKHNSFMWGNVLKKMSAYARGAPPSVLIAVYKALSLSRIMYSAHLMLNASNGVFNELELIQNRQVKVCLGLLNDTNPGGALAEAGLFPVRIMAKQKLVNKITSMAAHFPGHRLLREMRVRQGSEVGRVFLEMEALGATATPPKNVFFNSLPGFLAEPVIIIKDIQGLKVKKGDLDSGVIQKLAQAHCDEVWGSTTLRTYTDGSCVDGSSGAGVYCNGQLYSIGLPFETSSTTAELVAIREALRHLLLLRVDTHVILTDSMSALSAIASDTMGVNPLLVRDIQLLIIKLKQHGSSIGFQWVPSHCGIEGNEKADMAAGLAHGNAGKIGDVFPDKNDLRRRAQPIIDRLKAEWWHTCVNTHRYFIDSEMPKGLLKLNGIPRRMKSVIHRLRCGNVLSGQTLCRYKFISDPLCSVCGVVDDQSHILEQCCNYSDERRDLEEALGELDIQSSPLCLRQHPEALPVLRRFLWTTDLYKLL